MGTHCDGNFFRLKGNVPNLPSSEAAFQGGLYEKSSFDWRRDSGNGFGTGRIDQANKANEHHMTIEIGSVQNDVILQMDPSTGDDSSGTWMMEVPLPDDADFRIRYDQ